MNATPRGIAWVKDGCPRCAAVKEHLSGRRIECRPIDAVLNGQAPHCVDAMAQLAWQDYELPVVLLDGEFVEPAVLLNEHCAGPGSTPSPDPSGAPDSCGASCQVVPKG